MKLSFFGITVETIEPAALKVKENALLVEYEDGTVIIFKLINKRSYHNVYKS